MMSDSLIRDALARARAETSDFDLNPDVQLPEGRVLRDAAVLVAITPDRRVILTKRSSKLKHHPGQIAFPGGKVDDGDASIEVTALREAREEIGLPEGLVQSIGVLPCHETVTGFRVTPIIAQVTTDFEVKPELGEVEEVFSVPLDHLLTAANYRIERRRWRGVWRRYYVVPFGPYYIWGATARMLRSLAQ